MKIIRKATNTIFKNQKAKILMVTKRRPKLLYESNVIFRLDYKCPYCLKKVRTQILFFIKINIINNLYGLIKENSKILSKVKTKY